MSASEPVTCETYGGEDDRPGWTCVDDLCTCCSQRHDARVRREVLAEVREALPKAGLYLADFHDLLDELEAKS